MSLKKCILKAYDFEESVSEGKKLASSEIRPVVENSGFGRFCVYDRVIWFVCVTISVASGCLFGIEVSKMHCRDAICL